MSNKQIVYEAITGLFIRRYASVLDTHFHPDYKQHNPTIGNGVSALRALAPKLSPNLRYEPGMIVEDGHIVMIHGRCVGWGTTRSTQSTMHALRSPTTSIEPAR
jgi:predicted SnoaL-like aldol condensation-catalyzing enzyme